MNKSEKNVCLLVNLSQNVTFIIPLTLALSYKLNEALLMLMLWVVNISGE